jgi:hypothetical protein
VWRVDVGYAAGIQDCGSRQNDKKGNRVGKDHTDDGVDPDSIDFTVTSAREVS